MAAASASSSSVGPDGVAGRVVTTSADLCVTGPTPTTTATSSTSFAIVGDGRMVITFADLSGPSRQAQLQLSCRSGQPAQIGIACTNCSGSCSPVGLSHESAVAKASRGMPKADNHPKDEEHPKGDDHNDPDEELTLDKLKAPNTQPDIHPLADPYGLGLGSQPRDLEDLVQ